VQKPENIRLLGGTLCLEFVNSVDWTDAGEPFDDALSAPDALVRWGRRLGVLGRGDGAGGEAAARGGEAAARGGEAAAGDAVAREAAAARELRADLRAVLVAAAGNASPPPDAAAAVLRTYAEATAAAHLSPGYALDWPDADPRKVRFAVVADAISLLGDARRLARVHVCPGRDCGWLFLDTSGRRKWCSMATCGSRAKMRAMYARRKEHA
jgi:predicted RNA-binding Zn ribbon-like protein